MAVIRTVGDGPSPEAEAGPAAERSGSLRPIHPPRSAAAALALDVFERYPYGIVVVTRDGEVVAHNVAARRLMGDLASRLDEPGPGVLCEPLCCCKDEEGGHFEGVCLFQRAADAHETLPEVRVDMPPGAGAPALWITAAPLGGDGQRVIVELRPGQANDRRRRTTPHWTHGPTVRVHVLGRTRVDSVEGPLGGRWLENRAGQVLKYLVAERQRVVYADELVETLWADAGVRSLPGVRYFIHELRDRLEPQRARRGGSSFVVRTQGGYALDRARVWIDADEFERAITEGLVRLEAGDARRARDELRRGIDMYEGDFVADEPYAEWAIVERDRLRRVAARALRALSRLELDSGDVDAAVVSLERLTDLEPYDADIHRELIGLVIRLGRRTEAVRRYEALRRRMLATFGEDLDFTLGDVIAA